ncbi:MAG: hypothetical protein KAT58_02675 [candidate division Zixibacteria bacterium]|nr:hypothetical protein [candidate division Zixibacteria bacterium]
MRPNKPDWSYESRCLALQVKEMNGADHPGVTDIYPAANAYWKSRRFHLPRLTSGRKWYRVVDTMLKNPDDISEQDREPILNYQAIYNVSPRSVVVLTGK